MTLGAPKLTPIARLLMRWLDAAAEWPLPLTLLASSLAFTLLMGVDYATHVRIGTGAVYLLVCAAAVWCSGERAGFAVAVLGALGAAAIRHGQPQLPLGQVPQPALELWNLFTRLATFTLVALVIHGFKRVLALERWRANHDELTSALNKAGFERAMGDRIRHARGRGGNLLLAYLDLDGFKKVNDQHGHSAGDHVLRQFAGAATGAIRPTDLFARFGGDEFAALLTLPAHVDGHRVAELLHQRLTAVLHRAGFDVTCSMGAVLMGVEEAGVDLAIVEQADALMYEVKRAGKNAFRVARGHAINKMLRAAFQPLESDELDDLLRSVDIAERRQRWQGRRAA